jgi:hypothetical protein
VESGTRYVSVYFTEGTNSCLRDASRMFVVGVDRSDWKSGAMAMIREDVAPIPG